MTRAAAHIALACAVAMSAAHAAAQYPNRPIRIVTGFAAGATSDAIGRILGQKITDTWNQQVIVDNRPGASGMVGAEIVARSAPDGHTLALVVGAIVVHPSLFAKVPYDPIRDFAPIAMIGRVTTVIAVHPSLPARSVRELVALAKAQPGKLVYGTGGAGSSAHLTAELFKQLAHIDIVHVPYKGGAPAITDLLGGQIPMTFSVLFTALPHIKSGRVIGLAVTSAQRQPVLPQTPTLAESGYPGFDTSDWWALLAPSGTPADIVGRLNAETNRILRLADVRERFAALAIEPLGGTGEHAAQFMQSEMDKWAKVVRQAGLKID